MTAREVKKLYKDSNIQFSGRQLGYKILDSIYNDISKTELLKTLKVGSPILEKVGNRTDNWMNLKKLIHNKTYSENKSDWSWDFQGAFRNYGLTGWLDWMGMGNEFFDYWNSLPRMNSFSEIEKALGGKPGIKVVTLKK